MTDPKVSIIIPVYNGSNFLSQAIECALKQTYENIEILVINDGSIDDGETERIALSFGNRIRYFSKENGGVSSALNLGIQKMTGDYFSWLSHDDAYSPDKVADSINLLKKHKLLYKRCIAFTGGTFIDLNGDKIRGFRTYFESDNVYSGVEVVNIMTQKGTLNGCCMLIPKRVFEEVGFFDETLRYSQDSLMWYRIFLSGCAMISDNKLNVMYRLHRNQTSQNRRDLYEKDALVIARYLARSLLDIDKSGKTLYRYIKRLMKYQCRESINYLYEFGKRENCFSKVMLCSLNVSKVWGYFRYKAVTGIKRCILALRR